MAACTEVSRDQMVQFKVKVKKKEKQTNQSTVGAAGSFPPLINASKADFHEEHAGNSARSVVLDSRRRLNVLTLS